MNISQKLLEYYDKQGRELPWRFDKKPYNIWLSEIILQQTRIDQGLIYYLRFIDRYPNVFALAKATEDEVLIMWQGLGYYSRALNLHKAAKIIVNENEGVFPTDYRGWKALPGIGDYTASAISSIVNNEVQAALDGNVFRVLSRLFAIDISPHTSGGRKLFREKAFSLIDINRPGDFNQAIMEYGARVCVPQNPDCEHCIIQKDCRAFVINQVHKFPLKKKAISIRKRYLYYLVLLEDTGIVIRKRGTDDIWRGLYEFPFIECLNEVNPEEIVQSEEFAEFCGRSCSIEFVEQARMHKLSHQEIFPVFIGIKGFNGNWKRKRCKMIDLKMLGDFPFPKPLVKFIQKYFI